MTEFIKRVVTSFILGATFWISFIYLPPFYFSFILLAILIQIILFEWQKLFTTHRLSFWLLTLLYPILPFVLLIVMNQHPMYHNLLLELFIIVASLDTGSYIVGTIVKKIMNTHYILPHVSPGKTWEGFIGGYIFATIGLGLLVIYEQEQMLSWWIVAGFSLIICVLALLGDLFESWLKRRAGIKDIGNILPVHGGFLDRFDGILFAVFFFYIFKNYLVRLFG